MVLLLYVLQVLMLFFQILGGHFDLLNNINMSYFIHPLRYVMNSYFYLELHSQTFQELIHHLGC